MPAYYRNTFEKFLSDDDEKILGHLADGVAEFDRSRSTQTEHGKLIFKYSSHAVKKF